MYSGLIFWYLTKKYKEHVQEDESNAWRDADVQVTPYGYVIGRHANETLALRYGLANSHGETENQKINLRKLRLVKKDLYEVELTDFGSRRAIAVIEKGTDYVKTFYPMSEKWFVEQKTLEELLKNNKGIKLYDIAKYHIETKLEKNRQK